MSDIPTPFVLLARITVKQGMINEYLSIAEEADKVVKRTKEGMLFQNFDADPDDPHKFVWTEVYRKSENFYSMWIIRLCRIMSRNIVTWPRISQLKFMEMFLKL